MAPDYPPWRGSALDADRDRPRRLCRRRRRGRAVRRGLARHRVRIRAAGVRDHVRLAADPARPLMRYVHTNLVARDWRRLADFYVNVFRCAVAGPERDLHGDWLDTATALSGA